MFQSLNNEIGKYRLTICMNSNNPNVNDSFLIVNTKK